jgi:hypothetical protein
MLFSSWVAPEHLICPPGLQLNLLRKAGVHLAKPPRCVRPHPTSSANGRVSPRRCSCRASRARDRNTAGFSRKLRVHASSSSRVSMIWDAMASCSPWERDSTRRNASSSRPVIFYGSANGNRPMPGKFSERKARASRSSRPEARRFRRDPCRSSASPPTSRNRGCSLFNLGLKESSLRRLSDDEDSTYSSSRWLPSLLR